MMAACSAGFRTVAKLEVAWLATEVECVSVQRIVSGPVAVAAEWPAAPRERGEAATRSLSKEGHLNGTRASMRRDNLTCCT